MIGNIIWFLVGAIVGTLLSAQIKKLFGVLFKKINHAVDKLDKDEE